MAAVQLNHEASAALVTEGRREFENGAHELWGVRDQSQVPILDACVEIIGRLAHANEHWPQEESVLGGHYDKALVEFEFTSETLAWLERQCASQAEYVVELDSGSNAAAEPGYIAEQVYLLHVLRGVVAQREAVAV